MIDEYLETGSDNSSRLEFRSIYMEKSLSAESISKTLINFPTSCWGIFKEATYLRDSRSDSSIGISLETSRQKRAAESTARRKASYM